MPGAREKKKDNPLGGIMALLTDMSMGMGSRRVGDRSGTLSLTPPAIGGGKGARPGDVIEPRRCLSMLTLRYASARSLLAPLPPP